MDQSKQPNELENNNKNQHFNTFDVLSVFLCLGLVVAIGALLYNSHIEHKKTVETKKYVENLAQELIMKPVISSIGAANRLPASDIDLGADPWGSAYKYSVVKNSYGQPIYVVVLSSGPNTSFETEVAQSMAFSQSNIQNIKFEGDDIGYIKSFR